LKHLSHSIFFPLSKINNICINGPWHGAKLAQISNDLAAGGKMDQFFGVFFLPWDVVFEIYKRLLDILFVKE
jgi:hypothetical protein